MRPRGGVRGQMVSVHRRRGYRACPDLHVARREWRLAKEEARMHEAHAWRTDTIERLKGVLVSGDVSELLTCSNEEGVLEPSAAQTQRLTTQGWALVYMYTEIDRLEAAISSGAEKPAKGGVVMAAARKAAEFVGRHPGTVRAWQLEYVSGGYKFAPDQRAASGHGSCLSTRSTCSGSSRSG